MTKHKILQTTTFPVITFLSTRNTTAVIQRSASFLHGMPACHHCAFAHTATPSQSCAVHIQCKNTWHAQTLCCMQRMASTLASTCHSPMGVLHVIQSFSRVTIATNQRGHLHQFRALHYTRSYTTCSQRHNQRILSRFPTLACFGVVPIPTSFRGTYHNYSASARRGCPGAHFSVA